MKAKKSDIRVIKITLPKEQALIVRGPLVEKIGNNPAEVVSTMVYDWLVQNNYLKTSKSEKKV